MKLEQNEQIEINEQSEQPVPQKAESEKVRSIGSIVWTVVFGLLFLIGCTLFVLGIWYNNTYGLELNELLYTLTSPLQGTGQGVIEVILRSCLPWVCVSVAVFVGVAIFLFRQGRIYRLCRRIGAGVCSLILVGALIFSALTLNLPDYLRNKNATTNIYEACYVDPRSVVISAENGEPRNLIYIYLESMETTYASKEDGGSQNGVNYIPKLTELAYQELFFTDSSEGLLGGFHSPTGAGWTMAALLSTTAGIPFSFPIEVNADAEVENLAKGAYSIGNVLADQGYRQMFLCGSDSVFGGRRSYFECHGNYEIFDLYTAREEGYIAEDYAVWWGYEDAILYEIAKDKVTEMANGDQPFNFTMLTVDTHHVDGYICNVCDTSYGEQLETVLHCADKLLTDFIDWCREQPFYENTTIVITGDHPRMDTTYVSETNYYDRTIYNCFINAAVEPQGSTTGRVFTAFDMFPTTLAAMGFSIEGDRLALGVNLFSDQQTLAERLGFQYFNQEISKQSEYYIQNFS